MPEQADRETPPAPTPPPDSDIDGVFRVLSRIITILGWILVLPILTLCGIMVVYVYLVISPGTTANVAAAEKIGMLITVNWDRVLPIGTQIIKMLSPVLVLVLGIAVIRIVNRDKQGAIRFGEILSDLPSVLAITIVVAICLLPFTDVVVPEVLNNVALVVIGFYFGRGRQPGSPRPGGEPDANTAL
jgi:hypothetical protein